jgi:hypothetical protein
MKMQRIITLLTSLIIMLMVIGTVSADPSLVGHWKFDEGTGTTAFDSSGNGNDGTLINGPIWTTGVIGQALEFDGTDDYVDVGTGPAITGAAQRTVSMWINPDTIDTTERHFFGYGATGNGQAFILMLKAYQA